MLNHQPQLANFFAGLQGHNAKILRGMPGLPGESPEQPGTELSPGVPWGALQDLWEKIVETHVNEEKEEVTGRLGRDLGSTNVNGC